MYSGNWFKDIIEDNPKSYSIDKNIIIQKMTTLFTESDESLKNFTASDIATGLSAIMSATGFGLSGILIDKRVDLDLRIKCIKSMHTFFEQFFNQKCKPILTNSSTSIMKSISINEACFMWWDWCLIVPKYDSDESTDIDNNVIKIMESILKLDSIACRESALHGLGHWADDYPEQIGGIIDNYVSTTQDQQEIILYAEKAKQGLVL